MIKADSKYWWENLQEAGDAYRRVCAGGWEGVHGLDIACLYDRAEPDGLFVAYYGLLAAIQDYVSTKAFRAKYMKEEEKPKGSEGGPQ